MSKLYVEINNSIDRSSEKAMLIDGTWIPKSQVVYVMNWNHLDTNDSYKVKKSDRKATYTMLIPLWLYNKNFSGYKEARTLDTWTKLYNRDDRVNFEYEAFRLVNNEERQQLLNDTYQDSTIETIEVIEDENEVVANLESYGIQLNSLLNNDNKVNNEKLLNAINKVVELNFNINNYKDMYKMDFFKEFYYQLYRLYRIDLRIEDFNWYHKQSELVRIANTLNTQDDINLLIEKLNNVFNNDKFKSNIFYIKRK